MWTHYSIKPFLVGLSLLSGSVGLKALEFEDAYIRAMPPGAQTTAIYGRFVNLSNQPLTLKNFSLKGAEKVELHEHVLQNGVVKMRSRADALQLKAGESVELTPGGLHLMVYGVRVSSLGEIVTLKVGTTVSKTYPFSIGFEKDQMARSNETLGQETTHNHH